MRNHGKAPPGTRVAPAVVAAMAALLVLAAAPASGVSIVVDSFNDGLIDPGQSVYGPFGGAGSTWSGFQTDSAPLVDIIGGRRDVTLTWISGTADAKLSKASVLSGTGTMDLDNEDLVVSKLLLEYGKTSDLSADLTVGGAYQLLVHFVTMDTNPASVTMTVTSDNSGTPVTVSIPKSTPSGLSSAVLVFDHADFTGVNFTDVDYLSFEITTAQGGDYTIELIESGIIPEPLTMLGVFSGVAGLAGYVRKRRSR